MKPYLFLFAFCVLGFQTAEVNAQRKKTRNKFKSLTLKTITTPWSEAREGRFVEVEQEQ